MSGSGILLRPINLSSFSKGNQNPPELVNSPQSSTESVGFFHVLTAEFTGENLSYQWYENGVAMSGETNTTLELTLNSSMNGNSYYCRAVNPYGQYVDSNAAVLSLRPRIYMNWDITIPSIDTTGKIYLTFRSDGSVTYSSDISQVNEEWCSSATDPNLAFNISDYEVQINTLSGEAVVDSTSDVGFDFVEMFSDITVVLDVSSVPLEESRNFNVKVRDKIMPNYNWAGWDNDTLFYRRTS